MQTNQKINISHDTNTQLFVSKECHSKETISEYDFWIGLKNAQAAHSVPSINISDIGSILKYTSISEIKIKAKNQDDINKISEIFKKVSVPVAVNVKDFKYIKYIPNNLKVNIFTPDVASLNKETLEKLEAQHINIENVAIPMNYYNNNYYYEHELDSFQFYNYNPNKRDIFYGSDVYNIDTYKKIVEKLQEITNGITPKNSEFKKFMTIYYRLSSAICYNFFNDDECVSLYRADIHLIIILKVVQYKDFLFVKVMLKYYMKHLIWLVQIQRLFQDILQENYGSLLAYRLVWLPLYTYRLGLLSGRKNYYLN